MDITTENFLQFLPEITETIQGCDFIAIDTELSGLVRERSVNRFDLPEERFSKSVESSRGYFIMQFGLSCFKCLDNLSYSNRTYNFYIFPQPHNPFGDINRTFSIQAHAVQFLIKNNFDFNKLFRSGLSFMTFQEKQLLTTQLKSDLKFKAKTQFDHEGVPKFIPCHMKQYCKDWIKKLDKFVTQMATKQTKSFSTTGDKTSSDSGSDAQITNQNKVGEMQNKNSYDVVNRLELRDCQTNHRRSIMKKVLDCIPAGENLLVTYETDFKTENDFLVVTYTDKETKIENQKNEILTAKGFLEIIELIIVNKKPLIGHNLMLDLIQTINQFIDKLSEDYFNFKETCHDLFPIIYDTKYIAHQILDPKTLTSNQSRLNDLYWQLKDSSVFPTIKVAHLGEFYDEKQAPHLAGYDAYMSGYCFIALCEGYLKQDSGKKSKQSKLEDNVRDPSVNPQIINEFSNRIHLPYSYDFKYLYLSGNERVPDRSHVFFVEFPGSWTLDDLFKLFQQYGGVEASRLSKTTALCALRDRKHLDSVKQLARDSKNAGYKIVSYDEYVATMKFVGKKAPEDDDIDFVDASDANFVVGD